MSRRSGQPCLRSLSERVLTETRLSIEKERISRPVKEKKKKKEKKEKKEKKMPFSRWPKREGHRSLKLVIGPHDK
jgi:hypothetical protein